MSEITAKIYRAMVQAKLDELAVTAEKIGLKDREHQWILFAGSKNNRVPWTLLVRNATGHVVEPEFLPEHGELGWKYTEAANCLDHYNRAWKAILNREREQE